MITHTQLYSCNITSHNTVIDFMEIVHNYDVY